MTHTSDAVPAEPTRAMRAAAEAAVAFVEPGTIIGVGTGRTATAFVGALATSDRRPRAAVASSSRTAELLAAAGIRVVPLWGAGLLPLYVDGADVADSSLRLIKGGGGAHGGERLVADASQLFVCIVDDTKLAETLDGQVVPLEVLPSMRTETIRRLSDLGATAVVREDFLTDAGNEVLDAAGLDLSDPLAMELALDDLPGIVASGIFASRPADILLVGHENGTVDEYRR